MYQDRFDIVEAHLLAYMHCHGGQWTREYRRMCKILTYYKPGRSFGEETLTENGREIYDALCEKLLGEKA
jgi:hypothetical protein